MKDFLAPTQPALDQNASPPNSQCFVLARGSHVNTKAPDADPCPTELCVRPGLVASRAAVSHPSWRVLALVHAQAGGASQLTCTLVEWYPVPPPTFTARSSQPCKHLKSQMRLL